MLMLLYTGFENYIMSYRKELIFQNKLANKIEELIIKGIYTSNNNKYLICKISS